MPKKGGVKILLNFSEGKKYTQYIIATKLYRTETGQVLSVSGFHQANMCKSDQLSQRAGMHKIKHADDISTINKVIILLPSKTVGSNYSKHFFIQICIYHHKKYLIW